MVRCSTHAIDINAAIITADTMRIITRFLSELNSSKLLSCIDPAVTQLRESCITF